MKRLLSALLLFAVGGVAHGAGSQTALTVSSGTFQAVSMYSNNDGANRQAIVIGDFTSSDTVRVDNITGMRVSLSTSALTTATAVKVDGSAVTQPVSGTLSFTPPALTTVTFNGSAQPVTQSGAFIVTQSTVGAIPLVGGAAVTAANPLPVQSTGTTTVAGTVTANAGTNLNTSLLALEAGGNLATLAGGITSTRYMVNISSWGGAALTTANPLPTHDTGTVTITGSISNTGFNVNNSPTVFLATTSVSINGSSNTVVLGAGAATIGALTANQSVNEAQINGVAVSMGSGVNGTGVQRVTIATDQTQWAVNMTTSVMNSAGAFLVPVSTFANVAASQTDQVLVSSAATKVCVVAAVGVAGATATNLTFNSKGAGAGTAITALFSNGANGGMVLPRNDLGWFCTNAAEQLSVTTGSGSTTGIQILYNRI